MRISVAFIDIGGTLITGPPRGPAARLADSLGLGRQAQGQLTAALMTKPWDDPDQVVDFVCSAFGIPRARARSTVRKLWTKQQNEAVAIDGAQAALESFAKSGIRLGIISNIWHPYLVAAHRVLGDAIERLVTPDLRFYSYREGVAKPCAAIFLRALAAAKVDPEEAVMIGDSYREDVEPAAILGLNTIWLLHRPEKEAENAARILNGLAPRPTITLCSVTSLRWPLMSEVVDQPAPNLLL
jgi:HAD superfamily hydrolase (TIGR01549 family)